MTIVSEERDYTLALKEGWFGSIDAEPRSQPLSRSLSELRAMATAERASYEESRSVWHANLGPISTPQMLAVHDDLDEIVAANRQDGDKVKGRPSSMPIRAWARRQLR